MEYSYALINTSVWKANWCRIYDLFGEFTIKYFVLWYLQKDQNDSSIPMHYWSWPVDEVNDYTFNDSEDNFQVPELR